METELNLLELSDTVSSYIDYQIIEDFNYSFDKYRFLFNTIFFDKKVKTDIPTVYSNDIDLFDYILLKVKEYYINLLLAELSIISDIENKNVTKQRTLNTYYTSLVKNGEIDFSSSTDTLIKTDNLRKRIKTINNRKDRFKDSITKGKSKDEIENRISCIKSLLDSDEIENKKSENLENRNIYKSYEMFYNRLTNKFNEESEKKFLILNLAFVDKLVKDDEDVFSFTSQSAGNYCTFLYRNFIDQSNIFTVSDTAISSLIENRPYIDSKTRQRICKNYNKNIDLINKVLTKINHDSATYHVNRFLFESIYHTDFFKSTAFSFFSDIIRKIHFISLYDHIKDLFSDKKLYLSKDWLYSDPQFKKSLFFLDFLDIAKKFNLNITDSMLSIQLYKTYNPVTFTTKSGNIITIENTIKNPQNLLKEQTLLYDLLPHLMYDFLVTSLDNAHELCEKVIRIIFDKNVSTKRKLDKLQNKKIKEIELSKSFITEMNISFSLQPFENANLKKIEERQKTESNKDITFEKYFAENINNNQKGNLNKLCSFLANEIDKMYSCTENKNKRPLLKNIKYADISSTFTIGNAFIFPYLLKKDFD